MTQTTQQTKTRPYEAAMRDMGITITSEFVPFSQSRSKDEKRKSLNWIVILMRNGKKILVTDYAAGAGHCPAYKAPLGGRDSICNSDRIDKECEKGYALRPKQEYVFDLSQPLLPEGADVLYSLLIDSEVLDHADFEEWASNSGYDTDSRTAEKIYEACMKIALQFRRAFSDVELTALRSAFQDY